MISRVVRAPLQLTILGPAADLRGERCRECRPNQSWWLVVEIGNLTERPGNVAHLCSREPGERPLD